MPREGGAVMRMGLSNGNTIYAVEPPSTGASKLGIPLSNGQRTAFSA